MNKLIYWPLKPYKKEDITQRFGENLACVPLTGEQKTIYCDGNNPPDGYRSIYGPQGHQAIDIRTFHGQEVYAAQGGTIYYIDTQPKSGLDVRIESVVDGRRIRHIYEHLMGYQGKVGDKVEVGQVIGWADNTGWSSGDHLHFSVLEQIGGKWKFIDPLSIMSDKTATEALFIKNKIIYLSEQVGKIADLLADYLRNRNK